MPSLKRKLLCWLLFPIYLVLRCLVFLPHLVKKIKIQRKISKEFYGPKSFLKSVQLKERKLPAQPRKLIFMKTNKLFRDKRQREFVQVLARAFYNDPIGIFFYNDKSMVTFLNYKFFTRECHNASSICYALKDVKGDAANTIAGCCVWRMGHTMTMFDTMGVGSFFLWESDLSWDEMTAFQKVDEKGKEIMKDQKHFMYLAIIGVEPFATGRGYGTDLLTPMLKYADEKKLCCYLESSNPRNVSFYERLGFVAKEVVTMNSCRGNVAMTLMRRDPK